MVIKSLRTLAGFVLGYAAMVILITLVQEAWFGGVGWYESPLGTLAVAGFFTCVAAGVGGLLATIVALPTGRLAAALMSALVVVETTALLLTGRTSGPVWFDALAAASLIVAILLGAEALLRYREPAPQN